MDFTLCVVLVECHILEVSTRLVHKCVIVRYYMYITFAQEIMIFQDPKCDCKLHILLIRICIGLE